MFEGVVTAVLNKFLGDYVSNMEGKQLSLGLFSGNIELTDLRLKKEALDKLNLPIEVFHGHLGRLELHIPWRKLKTEPVTVLIENLFVVAGPRSESKYDQKLEEEREQKSKQEALETAELFSSTIESELADDVKQQSFTDQLVTKIVDNLQITVKNIHIRFEDKSSNASRMFCVGVTLKNLSAVSTDENWSPSFIVNPQDAINKLVKLDLLSLYWNISDRSFASLPFEDFVSSSLESLGDDSHSFIVQPVSGQGKAILHKKKKENVAKTLLNVIFEAISVNVNYEQYYDILCLLANFSASQRSLPYRKYRPGNKSLSPQQMWKFAADCFVADVKEINRRRSWAYILQRRADRKDYVNLFSNKILLGELNKEDSVRLAAIEARSDLEDLLRYRSMARSFARRSTANSPKRVTWFWGWMGYKNAATSDLVKDDDIKELYETIDYNANDEGGEDMAGNEKLLQVDFELSKGSLSFLESPKSTIPLVCLNVFKLTAQFFQRPSTIAFEMALQDMKLVENMMPDSYFKDILQIKPVEENAQTNQPFFFVSFDQLTKNPHASADARVVMQPLVFAVNVKIAEQLLNYFLNPQTAALIEDLKAEAKKTIEHISVQTRASLQRALETHKAIDLKIMISAPIVLIPEDPCDLEKSLFILDLGKLSAVSEFVTEEERQEASVKRRTLTSHETEEFENLLFDRIKVKLRQFAFYFVDQAEGWYELLSHNLSEKFKSQRNKIMNEIDIYMLVQNSIITTAANIPKMKVTGVLPEISVFLSDRKLRRVISLLNNLLKGRPVSQEPVKSPSLPHPKSKALKKMKSSMDRERDDVFYDAFDDQIDNSSQKKHPADDEKEADTFNMLVNFVVERVAVHLCKDEDFTEILKFSVVAEELSLNMTAYDTVMSLKFALGGIGLREHYGDNEEFLIVDAAASDSTEENLLDIVVDLVQPSNENFTAVYKDAERVVSIRMAKIKAFVDPESALRVAKFGLVDLLPIFLGLDLPDAKPAEHVHSQPSSLVIEEVQPKTMVSFSFSGLGLYVMDSGHKIFFFEAEQFILSLILSGKHMAVDVDVLAMRVAASDGHSIVDLIYFEGDSVLNAKFELNCPASENIIEGSNMLVYDSEALQAVFHPAAIVNAARTVFKFFKIIDYLPKDINKDAKAKSSAPSSESSTTTESVASQIFTYLKVNMKAPLIVFPSQKKDALLAIKLGAMKVDNVFEKISEDSEHCDQFLRAVVSESSVWIETAEKRSTLLEHCTLPFEIRISHDAFNRKFADVEVDGEIPSILFAMSEIDYAHLMSIAMNVATSVIDIVNLIPRQEVQVLHDVMEKEEEIVEKVAEEVKEVKEVKEAFPFDAKLRFNKIGFLVRDPSEKDMVDLNIEGINVMAVMHTVRGLAVEVGVESFSIKDRSDSESLYNDLLLMGEAAEGLNKPIMSTRKQIIFRMEQPINQPMQINVFLESPRVFILFDAIFYLQKFFLGPLQNIELPKKVDSSTSAKEAQPTSSKPKVHFELLDASLTIPDDRKNKTTTALDIRVGGLAVELEEDLKLSLSNVTSIIYNMSSSEDTQVTLLESFSTVLKISKDEVANESVLVSEVDPVRITLSYQDLKVILDMVNSMAAAQARHKIEKPDLISDSESVSTFDASEASVDITPVESSERGKINIDFVRVVIVDDSKSSIVPLLELSISKICTEVSNWSTNPIVDLQATLSADCYEPSVSYWEPIIEPWEFSIRVGPSDLEPQSESTLLITSEKNLNVLVVHHALERILSLLQKLGADKKKYSATRKMSDPYVFGNYSEYPVIVLASGMDDKNVEIQPQQKKGFTFKDWLEVRSEVFAAPNKVVFDFGQEHGVTPPMIVDSDGCFPLKFSTDTKTDTKCNLYVQNEIDNGVRYVSIRGRHVIYNETDKALIVTFSNGESGKSLQIDVSGKACIPVNFENSECRIAPLEENAQILPSIETFVPSKMVRVSGKIFSCEIIDGKTKAMNILASCVKPSPYPTYDIHFVAPVCVENLLPNNIQIQLNQDNVRTVTDIKENECVSLYHVNPYHPCFIAISIPDVGMFSVNECDILHKVSSDTSASTLVMQNDDGLELKVALTRDALPSSALKLTIAAFFVIVNQTGMQMQFLSEAANKLKQTNQTFTALPTEQKGEGQHLLFSYPVPKKTKNRVRLRVYDSQWSDPVSFDAVGADFQVDCKSMLTSKWFNLGGFIALGSGKFGLTKIVYISCRYYFVNDTAEDLMISDSQHCLRLPAKAQIPMQINPGNIESMSIGQADVPEGEEVWSVSFDLKNTGRFYLRDRKRDLLYLIQRTIESPCFFVTFSRTDSWPYILRNKSSMPMKFQQKNVDVIRNCPINSEVKYAWDQPSFSEKLLLVEFGDRHLEIDLAEIGRKGQCKVSLEGRTKLLKYKVKAKGPATVVVFRDNSLLTEKEDGKDKGKGKDDEKSVFKEVFQSVVLIKIPFIGISLIGSDLKEIILLSMRELEIRYAISKQFVSYGVTVKWMQVDNQAFDWDHPMLFYPSVISKSTKELNEHPFLSLGAIQSRDSSYGVTYFKYLGLLVQEMAIEAGEDLVRSLLKFANLSVLISDPDSILSEKDYFVQKHEVLKDSSEVLFFEFLQIHPIKVNLTFSRTENAAADNTSTSYNPLGSVIDVLTMTLGNISNAPMKFNALVLENILSRKDSLQDILISHYKMEALEQIHMVLGSADFLGNPVGLLSSVGSGVTDLFYEPYQGFVSDRPQDIGIGFARGGASLVKKTVSGLSGTLSAFTGSLGKGLSAVTMDKSYQQSRRAKRARNKPRHVLSGFSTGVFELYSGFKEGVTGLVNKPSEMAKEEGVGGFFKGLGIGLVGVVTKPVVGVIDMTNSLTEGIKGTAEGNENTVTQVRFPRIIPADRKVRGYNVRESFGQSILIGVIGFGKVGKEFYVAHIEVLGENNIVILTDERLIYASVDHLNIIWEVRLSSIVDIKDEPIALLIIINTSSNERRKKIIPNSDKETKDWFTEKIWAEMDSFLIK